MTHMQPADIRRRLNHPVIDSDGHWVELQSIFLDYLAETAGPKFVDDYRRLGRTPGGTPRALEWYGLSEKQRNDRRLKRPGPWVVPAETEYRAAVHIPGRYYDRLDDWGIDVGLVYPTLGIMLPQTQEADVRRAAVRAYNTMAADMFRPYSDRLVPAAVIPLNHPDEAIEALEHAASIGLKLAMMNGAVTRPLEVDAEWQSDPTRRRTYIDCIGMDSPYDYDPVWKKCVELKFAVTNHEGAHNWPDRKSPTSHTMNHLGHFAEGNQYFARGLFMGGVTQRHPKLNFGFLEGGVSWACQLLLDLESHWDKRNSKTLQQRLKPTLVNTEKLRSLFEHYAKDYPRFNKILDDVGEGKVDWVERDLTLKEMADRDANLNDFPFLKIDNIDDVYRLFSENFYFGCEADDPMNALAFDKKYSKALKPVLGSDIGHWDVVDPMEVMPEAWEMVEEGRMDEEQFCEFAFINPVKLHGGMNKDFFKGTIVEDKVNKILK